MKKTTLAAFIFSLMLSTRVDAADVYVSTI